MSAIQVPSVQFSFKSQKIDFYFNVTTVFRPVLFLWGWGWWWGYSSSGLAGRGGDAVVFEKNKMAADRWASFGVRVGSRRGSFKSAPGVEASCEAVGLVSLSHQPQFPGVLCIFRAHVLDVNLQRGGHGMRTRVEAWTTLLGDTNALTWQALRLSLISTWLVWEPTHIYTWGKEQFLR